MLKNVYLATNIERHNLQIVEILNKTEEILYTVRKGEKDNIPENNEMFSCDGGRGRENFLRKITICRREKLRRGPSVKNTRIQV